MVTNDPKPTLTMPSPMLRCGPSKRPFVQSAAFWRVKRRSAEISAISPRSSRTAVFAIWNAAIDQYVAALRAKCGIVQVDRSFHSPCLTLTVGQGPRLGKRSIDRGHEYRVKCNKTDHSFPNKREAVVAERIAVFKPNSNHLLTISFSEVRKLQRYHI